jgi:hypothetical protein
MDKLWEEIEATQIEEGDFLYITWIPDKGRTTQAPSMGEAVEYEDGVLYLLLDEKRIGVVLSVPDSFPVIMRKT